MPSASCSGATFLSPMRHAPTHRSSACIASDSRIPYRGIRDPSPRCSLLAPPYITSYSRECTGLLALSRLYSKHTHSPRGSLPADALVVEYWRSTGDPSTPASGLQVFKVCVPSRQVTRASWPTGTRTDSQAQPARPRQKRAGSRF